ncbi:hypothetical protein ABT353_04810, partial [Nonomuraea wenchangensis]
MVIERRSDLLKGLMWRTVDLFLAADPHAERCLEELGELLREHGDLAVGYVVNAIEVMLAVRAGRFDEAEKLAGECFERGVKAGDLDATGWLGGWLGGRLGAVRWFQGASVRSPGRWATRRCARSTRAATSSPTAARSRP